VRPSKWWLVIGTLAMLGAYWFVLAIVQTTRLGGAWLPYAVHVGGGVVGGAMLASCAPVRPWGAPVAAAIACVLVMALLFVVAPDPQFGWLPARSRHPWPLVGLLAALTAASAMAGAALVRTRRAALGAVKIATLSGFVIIGSLVIVSYAVPGSSGGPLVAWLLLVGVSVAIGALVQVVVQRRCPVACAAGALAIVVFQIGASSWSGGDLARAVLGAAFFAVFVYLGARLGWRWFGRHQPEAPAVPAAQLR
jgi:hypothetical protein